MNRTSNAPTQHRPRRGVGNLVLLQAQGAFSDNALKLMLMLYVGMLYGDQPERQGKVNAIIGGLFPVAFLVFSCWGGMVADKFSKRAMTLATKLAEVVIMALGLAVFVFMTTNGASRPSTLHHALF